MRPCSAPITDATSSVHHDIDTVEAPIFVRPRRFTGEKLGAEKEHFNNLLLLEAVRSSRSQWASPLHLVPKKKNDWQIIDDYRKLNSRTVRDR